MRVLARDVDTALGQVDLVVRDGAALVCCEVKTALVESLEELSRAETRPGRRFDQRRLSRQLDAARYLAQRFGGTPRVDLLELWIEKHSGRWRAELHRGMRAPLPRE